MHIASFVSLLCCGLAFFVASVKQNIPALNSYDPGTCDAKSHGHEVLVKDTTDKEIILICVEDKSVYQWRPIDGSKKTVGEFFNPGLNCSDILDQRDDAKDGFYWITLNGLNPVKIFCDMTTDGGGFMLIGRKTNSITWTVPSNNKTVEPYGEPHWSSSLGDAPILDFRVQMATKEDFKTTKAHWSFRLKSKRPLKNLMMITSGCDQRSAGIGDIAYVKDLLTEKIVTTTLRCSKFGLATFGWRKMNLCLTKPCPRGYAFHDIFEFQLDYFGGFSFSATGNISGIDYKATAFVGCDFKHCCGCYGPVGGTKDYCTENCKAINGGTVTKNVFTWFWVRSSLPKRLWKKCMDYQVKRNDGKLISYKLIGHNVVPVGGSCGKDSTLLHDGIVLVPDSSAAQKVPAVDGLLEYREDKQELYIRSNRTWNVLARENKIMHATDRKHSKNLDKIKKLEQNLNNEKTNTDRKLRSNLDKIKNLEQNLTDFIGQAKASLSFLGKCIGYKWLNESNRNAKYPHRRICDRSLSPGWYRFGGGAGIKMPTSCLTYRCGTHISGWMNGGHPTVAQGKVTRKVCYSYLSNCCEWSNNIEVGNCGAFYVYKLSPPPVCFARYCGSDN